MPFKNDREYRAMTMTAVENEDTKVRGYATTFDDPYVLYSDKDLVFREIIDHNALLNADMSDVIMQFDHEGKVYARTSNNTLTLMPDEHGLAIEADLSGTEIGRELYQEIKGGYITKMSWAFVVDNDEWTSAKAPDGRDMETRRILNVRKVYDVSAVSLPANDATEISARSLTDGVIKRLEAERLEALELRKRKMLLEERLK